MLNDISKTLNYPTSFFFQNENRYPTTNPFHRKKQSIPQKVLDKIEALANIKRMHIERLLDSIDLGSKEIPYVDKDNFESIEDMSLYVRSFLKIPRGPINSVSTLIEGIGIPIVLCNFYTDKIDGFTITTNTSHIIFVNKDMPWCRIRFTLSHEFGHIVLNHSHELGIEDEANKFASSFLMPKKDINKDFLSHKINLDKIASLKPYWKVSMQALIFRAKYLNFLEDNQYQYLWMTMNKLGYRKNEPKHLDIAAENPYLLKAIIDLHKNNLEYSESELMQLLHTNQDDFFELYPTLKDKPKKIKLTLVK